MTNSENILRRARAVAKELRDPKTVPTPFGDVPIEKANVVVDGVRSYVDIYLSEDMPERNYRIVNPPLMVRDVTAEGGFRYDPVAAVAHVIGSLGGARSVRGRRRR